MKVFLLIQFFLMFQLVAQTSSSSFSPSSSTTVSIDGKQVQLFEVSGHYAKMKTGSSGLDSSVQTSPFKEILSGSTLKKKLGAVEIYNCQQSPRSLIRSSNQYQTVYKTNPNRESYLVLTGNFLVQFSPELSEETVTNFLHSKNWKIENQMVLENKRYFEISNLKNSDPITDLQEIQSWDGIVSATPVHVTEFSKK